MHILYHDEKIQQILYDIFTLTGIKIAFCDNEYHYRFGSPDTNDFCQALQENGKNKCLCCESDNRLLEKCRASGTYEFHLCHVGLYDAAMPVEKDGITAGYVIMGRIRCPDSPQTVLQEEPLLSKLYQNIPVFSKQRLESLKRLIPNILFSDAIRIETESEFETIKNYISEHLSEDLTVSSLCKQFYLSKNHLYRYFEKNCNCTVNHYITGLRILRAKEQIVETEKPLFLIAEENGFQNYNYFCRRFKQQTGHSPSEYRKTAKELP